MLLVRFVVVRRQAGNLTRCFMYSLNVQELKFSKQNELFGLCQVVVLKVPKKELPERVFQVIQERIG